MYQKAHNLILKPTCTYGQTDFICDGVGTQVIPLDLCRMTAAWWVPLSMVCGNHEFHKSSVRVLWDEVPKPAS